MRANLWILAIQDFQYLLQGYQMYIALKSLVAIVYIILFLSDSFCTFELLLFSIFLRDIAAMVDNQIYLKKLARLSRRYRLKIMPDAEHLIPVLSLSYRMNDLVEDDFSTFFVMRLVYAYYPRMLVFDLALLNVFFLQCLLSIYFLYVRLTGDVGQCQNYTIYIVSIQLLLFYLVIFVMAVTFAVLLIFFFMIYLKVLYLRLSEKIRRYQRERRIQQLKSVPYAAIRQKISDKQCSICLQEYEADTEQVIVLYCNEKHHFHAHCIKAWLELKGQCPLCRTQF